MLTLKMIFILVFALKIMIVDGRVYCEDTEATAWQPLGFSCPITCKVMITAVDRLRIIDYQNLVNMQAGGSNKMPESKDAERSRQKDIPSYKPVHDNAEGIYSQTYEAFNKIVQTEQFFADFRVELANLTAVFNVTCYIMSNKTRLLWQVLNDCTVGKPKGYILNRFMDFLNTYADPEYGFDAGMTLIILRHLLGTANFRYGMMEAVLLNMKTALQPEDRGLAKEETIKLSNKHCLSMFVPGCYCNTGYY